MIGADQLIYYALKEDHGSGDHTTVATIPAGFIGKAALKAKEKGVISGIDVAQKVFKATDPSLDISLHVKDGQIVHPDDRILTVNGPTASLLQGERVALNFLQRLSGIATKTRQYVDTISDYPARILDTRKTTPLFRELEKKAVRDGGALNHRMGLYDMIMIKDNHIDFAGSIPKAIEAVISYLKKRNMDIPLEVEVRNFSELEQVLSHGKINRIMLDNFTPEDLIKAVEQVDKKYETEASGGITLENIRDYAASNVDFISVGALTHHIKSLDMSLNAL